MHRMLIGTCTGDMHISCMLVIPEESEFIPTQPRGIIHGFDSESGLGLLKTRQLSR